jgi:hypothetical protein
MSRRNQKNKYRMNNGKIIGGPNTPLIGQPRVLQGTCVLTPEFEEILKNWSKKTSLHPGEVSNTIFRLGLIALALMFADQPINMEDAERIIPKSDNERENERKEKVIQ